MSLYKRVGTQVVETTCDGREIAWNLREIVPHGLSEGGFNAVLEKDGWFSVIDMALLGD